MGCTGSCCVAFPFGRRFGGPEDEAAKYDGLKLISMLVPITYDEMLERHDKFNDGFRYEGTPERLLEDEQFYACANWNEETRQCMDYDNRPRMCRAFPYGRDCEHGCDCKDNYTPEELDAKPA